LPASFFERLPPASRPTTRARNRGSKGEQLEPMSDAELVDLTRAGDLDAFNRLAARWEDSLFRFVRRTLGNEDDARDVCQESLIKAYQNLARLRDGTKFKSWIHHIALNLCRDRFRSAKTRGDSIPIDEAPHVEPLEGGTAWAADVAAGRGSVDGLLREILSGIPVDQRTCLLLREYHGFNSEEIAEITGVPAATVRTRIFYGLKTVRKVMARRGLSELDFN